MGTERNLYWIHLADIEYIQFQNVDNKTLLYCILRLLYSLQDQHIYTF